ncbi:MAG: HNH endonuclease [Ktedonobacteraceae bacterium]|nr:HNH endonuclease [Ktedonobacteraceae bacterium]
MFTSEHLVEGNIYTRRELQDKFSIRDATIRNGVFKPVTYQSIWLFVTENKTPDRPQLHDYLDGDTLRWDGQPEGRTDKLVIEHEANGLELLVFYRKHKNAFPHYGFRYEGRFRYVSHEGSYPTHFILHRASSILATVVRDLEAIKTEESVFPRVFREGRQTYVLTSTHERNPNLRAASIDIHGTRCQICNFSFSETYGPLGEDFIEVHHLYPVSKYTGEMSVSPETDMAVVCSNCHRMIHRNPEKPLSLEELRQIVEEQRMRNGEQQVGAPLRQMQYSIKENK